MYYNFARVHKTLGVTPAMAAGISDHVWTLEEIIALLWLVQCYPIFFRNIITPTAATAWARATSKRTGNTIDGASEPYRPLLIMAANMVLNPVIQLTINRAHAVIVARALNMSGIFQLLQIV
jgi:multisubunit Na+/H+ antiporter MnhG subunit